MPKMLIRFLSRKCHYTPSLLEWGAFHTHHKRPMDPMTKSEIQHNDAPRLNIPYPKSCPCMKVR